MLNTFRKGGVIQMVMGGVILLIIAAFALEVRGPKKIAKFEKDCAADAGCAKLVSCLNACPAPKSGACIDACAGPNPPPGFEKLDALADCTKRSGQSGHTSQTARCDWPVGGGH